MISRRSAVTQDDVARAAGVSRGLVSLALNNSPKVARSTRDRIAAAAKELGYRPNAQAAMLASSRSHVVGVILPNLRNPHHDAIIYGLRDAARANGLTLMIGVAADDVQQLEDTVESFLSMNMLGLIFVSPWLSSAKLQELGQILPICIIGRRDVGGAVDTVRVDEPSAAALLIEHLQEAAVHSLLFVGPMIEADVTARERRDCLQNAAENAGLPMQQVEAYLDCAPTIRSLLATATPGTALIIFNDMMAIDAVQAVRSCGFQPGVDIPIVSYDNTYLAERAEFSLTSIDQPAELMGSEAIRLLLERASQPTPSADEDRFPAHNITFAPTLQVRASSQR